jgi:ubiquinol-cytochrome c reductase cytochrome c1 subunit
MDTGKRMNTILSRLVVVIGALVAASSAVASEAGLQMDRWPVERGNNLASLQSGARLFANYCLGCHSANLVRWNRLQQIGLDDRQIKEFLIFGNQKVGDTMRIAMTPAEAKAWFGKVPPDLSVITRARTSFDYAGTDYLYTLFRGYYRDNSMANGWNNVAFPSIGMPHIFWERQGPREATIEQVHQHEGDGKSHGAKFVRTTTVYDVDGFATKTETEITGPATEGFSYSFKPVNAQQARQFDSEVADLVGFLAFITDPSRALRVRIGVWVLVFLALFTVIAWRLNSLYWKDIK